MLRKQVLTTDWATVLTMQEQWQEIELERFGNSPTGELPIVEMIEEAAEVLGL